MFRTSVKVGGTCPQHFSQLARENNMSNNVFYHALLNFHMYTPDLLSFLLLTCQGLFLRLWLKAVLGLIFYSVGFLIMQVQQEGC